MKLKLLNALFHINSYKSEIRTPDKRYRGGTRPTGKFESKTSMRIDLITEYSNQFKLRDIVNVGEIGQFYITSIHIPSNQMSLLPLKIESIKNSSFSVQGDLEIELIGRHCGEEI